MRGRHHGILLLAASLLLAPCADAFAPAPPCLRAPARTLRTPLPHALAHRTATITCSASDARTHRVFPDDAAVGTYICERVAALAKEAIRTRGHFAMSIGSGTTVKPLKGLAESGVDFEKVHIFFGNERTEGDTAFKCYQGAQEFVNACDIPESQVYKVPKGDAAKSAEEYEKLIKFLARGEILDISARTGLPSLDLVLLGTGADGHTASLYPDSPQVLISPSKRLVVPADGKGGVTVTLDYIQSAKNVLISAGKKDQAQMVATALSSTSSSLPAGMIQAAPGTHVEWLLTTDSASLLSK